MHERSASRGKHLQRVKHPGSTHSMSVYSYSVSRDNVSLAKSSNGSHRNAFTVKIRPDKIFAFYRFLEWHSHFFLNLWQSVAAATLRLLLGFCRVRSPYGQFYFLQYVMVIEILFGGHGDGPFIFGIVRTVRI